MIDRILLLLPLLEYFNDHDILTRIISLLVSYPPLAASYIWDGFKYSDNKIIVYWQIYNFIFVSIILILLFLFLPIETIHCSDGSEGAARHKKIIEKGIDALRPQSGGDTFDNGVKLVAGAASGVALYDRINGSGGSNSSDNSDNSKDKDKDNKDKDKEGGKDETKKK